MNISSGQIKKVKEKEAWQFRGKNFGVREEDSEEIPGGDVD